MSSIESMRVASSSASAGETAQESARTAGRGFDGRVERGVGRGDCSALVDRDPFELGAAPLSAVAPAVWSAFVDAWSGRIQGGLPLSEHLLWSAIRVFGAFLLASLTAVPVGILMGVSRVARGLLDPPLEFYRPLPPLAYLPLVVIWFGIDETAKLIVIYLACFAPIAMAARAGVRSATAEQVNAAYSLGASFPQFGAPCRVACGAAGNTHGSADCNRLWLDHARCSGDGGRDCRARTNGAQRVELSSHRRGGDGHRADRVDRVDVRSGHAGARASAGAVEGQGLAPCHFIHSPARHSSVPRSGSTPGSHSPASAADRLATDHRVARSGRHPPSRPASRRGASSNPPRS